MAPIKKLLRKTEIFEHGLLNVKLLAKTSKIGSFKYHTHNWELEFHVHTDGSQLAIGAILA